MPEDEGKEQSDLDQALDTQLPVEQRTQVESVPPQPMFDDGTIAQQLHAARGELAQAKLKFHMARAGIPGVGGHPNQFKDEIAKLTGAIDFLEQLGREGMAPPPVGPELVVAQAIPDGDGLKS